MKRNIIIVCSLIFLFCGNAICKAQSVTFRWQFDGSFTSVDDPARKCKQFTFSRGPFTGELISNTTPRLTPTGQD